MDIGAADAAPPHYDRRAVKKGKRKGGFKVVSDAKSAVRTLAEEMGLPNLTTAGHPGKVTTGTTMGTELTVGAREAVLKDAVSNVRPGVAPQDVRGMVTLFRRACDTIASQRPTYGASEPTEGAFLEVVCGAWPAYDPAESLEKAALRLENAPPGVLERVMCVVGVFPFHEKMDPGGTKRTSQEAARALDAARKAYMATGVAWKDALPHNRSVFMDQARRLDRAGSVGRSKSVEASVAAQKASAAASQELSREEWFVYEALLHGSVRRLRSGKEVYAYPPHAEAYGYQGMDQPPVRGVYERLRRAFTDVGELLSYLAHRALAGDSNKAVPAPREGGEEKGLGRGGAAKRRQENGGRPGEREEGAEGSVGAPSPPSPSSAPSSRWRQRYKKRRVMYDAERARATFYDMKKNQGLSNLKVLSRSLPGGRCVLFGKYKMGKRLGAGAQGLVLRVATHLGPYSTEDYVVKMSPVLSKGDVNDPAYTEIRTAHLLTSAYGTDEAAYARIANFVRIFDWVKCKVKVKDRVSAFMKADEVAETFQPPPAAASGEVPWWDKELDVQFGVFEFADGGTLGGKLRGRSATLYAGRVFGRRRYFESMLVQIMGFMASLNDYGGCHYDLHTENILMAGLPETYQDHSLLYRVGADSYEVDPADSAFQLFKLNDFGFARMEYHEGDKVHVMYNSDFEEYGLKLFNPSHDVHKLGCFLAGHLLAAHVGQAYKATLADKGVVAVISSMINRYWTEDLVGGDWPPSKCASCATELCAVLDTVRACAPGKPLPRYTKVDYGLVFSDKGVEDVSTADLMEKYGGGRANALGIHYYTYLNDEARLQHTPASLLATGFFDKSRASAAARATASRGAGDRPFVVMSLPDFTPEFKPLYVEGEAQ